MGGKRSQQQEMAQVDSSERPSSPFWRSRSSSSQHVSGKSNKVVGASYSHADMLKFDSLSLGPGSRPRTPPTSSTRASQTPPARLPSPEKRLYSGYTSSALGESWDVLRGEEDIDEGDDDLMYEEDEDEFGLPSIASMRRKRSIKNRTLKSQPVTYPRLSQTSSAPSLAPPASLSRDRSSSFDIAEERNPLSYPSAKKGDGKILRPQYKEILKDPANSLHLIDHPILPSNASPKEVEAHNTRISRINKFKRILQATSVSLPDLRAAAWSGVPEEVRAITGQLLLGHLPTNSERRVATLERKRKEYLDAVRQAFSSGTMANRNGTSAGVAGLASQPPVSSGRGRGLDEVVWHQISIDVPRTNPHIPLYTYEATQRSLERILYVWAIRHPASGYVQGINDLATPFWQVFLGTYITDLNIESGMDPGQLPRAVLDAVEADTFWCLTKLLDGIQDNYIVAQPGIHRQVAALRDLTTRIDSGLAKHFENEHVEYMQFSFRWMNCLLMRELSIKNVIRMWDTYMAEENGFSQFHLYVCAAFLVKWSEQLMKMNFQEILMFLQALPTRDWTEKDIELLLSEAFIWQSLFRGSRAHLRTSNSTIPTGSLGPSG
ncbi:GTPase-activating protein gyp1 [Exophiala dermatitidis]